MCKILLSIIVLVATQCVAEKSLISNQVNKAENLFKSKESSTETMADDKSFDICELFNVTDETELLGLRGNGVTVVMKLAS